MQPLILPLDELIKLATVIAVARVEKIETPNGIRVATVVLLQPLKGCTIGQRLIYLASKTWACDISDAKLNETSLLLLHPVLENPFAGMFAKEQRQFEKARRESLRGVSLHSIVHSGNGRMAIVRLKGRECVKQPLYVTFPDELPTLPDPAPTYRSFDYATMGEMTTYIRRRLKGQSEKTVSSRG